MQIVPIWLQSAFSDWLCGRLYLDNGGNYRRHERKSPVAPYNRSLKRLYPDNLDFHSAAYRWLTLWEAVPTARMIRPEGVGRTQMERRS